MDEIGKQYKAIGLFSLELAIVAQFFILHHVLPLISSNPATVSWLNKFMVFLLSNTALYLILAKGPMYWFEKYGWKLLNPRTNVQGRWHYKVIYYPTDLRFFKKEGQERLQQLIEHLKDNHGEVWVDQSVFGISVQEGAGYLGEGTTALKTTWKGSSVSVSKNGTVIIHFTSNLGAIKFNGIDDLTVAKRDTKGRPEEMFGHFQMMPEGTEFVLRGEITYFR